MKFWELISAFRSEKEILVSILTSPKWIEFREYYQQFDRLVDNQDREVLDKEIPFQLAVDICSKSKMEFYYYSDRNPQIISRRKQFEHERYDLIRPLMILQKFGGQHLEEILEKGSSEIEFPIKE